MEIKQYLFSRPDIAIEIEVKAMTIEGALIEANCQLRKKLGREFEFSLTDGGEIFLYYFANANYAYKVIEGGKSVHSALHNANQKLMQNGNAFFRYKASDAIRIGFYLTILNEFASQFKAAVGIYRKTETVVAVFKQNDFTIFAFHPNAEERHIRFFWDRQLSWNIIHEMGQHDSEIPNKKNAYVPNPTLLCNEVNGIKVNRIKKTEVK